MPLTSAVVQQAGAPALLINGETMAPVMAYVKPALMGPFLEAGYRLFTAPVPRGWWVGPRQYDFRSLDRAMAEFIAQDDWALFMPRVVLSVEGATWWPAKHSGEMAVVRDCTTGLLISKPAPHPDTVFYLGHELDLSQYNTHSFHSRRWREDAAAALSALIRHCEQASYADRIWAYHIGGGLWGEWFEWHQYTLHGLGDYSQAAESSFASWQAGPDVEGTVPQPLERLTTTLGDFLDPRVAKAAIDYTLCHSQAVAATIEHVCSSAKQALDWRKIVGVFYGYTFSNMPRPQLNGHYAMENLLQSPSVDFIASPHIYDHRGHGGYHSSQLVADAVRRAGKLFLDEVDCKTMWTPKDLPWKAYVSQPSTLRDTVEMLKKDAAFALASGGGLWWMDLTGDGWFESPAAVEPLRRLRCAYEGMLGRRRQAYAEVALVVDEESHAYHKASSAFTMPFLLMLKQWHLSRMGAPFEQLFVSDLAHPNTPGYKLYIFPNLFYVTPAKLELIRQVQRSGATVLWMYAPAFLGPDGPQSETSERLTGFPLSWRLAEGELNVTVTQSAHPITAGLPSGFRYGTGVDREAYKHPPAIQYLPGPCLAPVFHLAAAIAPHIEVLGLEENTGLPGLAVREHESWRSVYSAAPLLSWQLLRNIARTAGVHLYSEDGDMVWGNEAFLAIYSPLGGKRHIPLPATYRVTDAYSQEILAEQARSLHLDMDPYSARLFFLDPI